MKTRKRLFLVNKIQDGFILYSTKISAAIEKSLWNTSMMLKILLNKSSESILDIKEVKNERNEK